MRDMSRPAVDPARPDADRSHSMRRLPGTGGAAVGLATGMVLSQWSARDVAATMAIAGVPWTAGPLGFAVVGGIVVGVIGWAALYLIWGQGGWLDHVRQRSEISRRPLSYDDLGPPPPREQPLPSDLDQPLSAFDPEAIDFYRRRLR
jgi:hypothetical protein